MEEKLHRCSSESIDYPELIEITENMKPTLSVRSDGHNIQFKIQFPEVGSISVCEIIAKFEYEYNIPQSSYYLVFDGKILNNWQRIYQYQVTPLKNTVELIPRLKGGGIGGDIMDLIIEPIEEIFSPIVAPFVLIGQVFEFFAKILVYIIKLFIWAVEFTVYLFSDLLNPVNFVTDFGRAFTVLIYTIFTTVFNVIYTFVGIAANTIGSMMGSTFWGWDQSNLSQEDKQSNYFKNSKNCRDKKCYLTEKNTVPFSILCGTILCPPLGVFMEYGITGWLNILICMGLTLLFYFPGLIYALLIIYNT